MVPPTDVTLGAFESDQRILQFPFGIHLLWASGRKLGDECSPVDTSVCEALLSRWVWVPISDAVVTGREQEGDAACAKGGKTSTDTISVAVRDCP